MKQEWRKFAELCKPGFAACTFSEQLIKACGNHEDIAWVVYRHNGDNSLKWMQRKIPALNGKTPASCIETHRNELHQILMAVPY